MIEAREPHPVLLSMRQCAKYLGIPISTFNNYRMRMEYDFPYVRIGTAKMVDPMKVELILLDMGYEFDRSGAQSLYECPRSGELDRYVLPPTDEQEFYEFYGEACPDA